MLEMKFYMKISHTTELLFSDDESNPLHSCPAYERYKSVCESLQ